MDATDRTISSPHELLDEKSSQHPNIPSTPVRSTHERPANEAQEKDNHVVEDDDALEPVVSRQASGKDADAIPNGGFWAWMQVLGSFFLMFNTWGIINSKCISTKCM